MSVAPVPELEIEPLIKVIAEAINDFVEELP